jgi:hypothetical protein
MIVRAIGVLGVIVSLSQFYRLSNRIFDMPDISGRDFAGMALFFTCSILLLISSIGIIRLRNWARIMFLVLLGITMVLLLLPAVILLLSGQYSLIQWLCKIDKLLVIFLVYLLVFAFLSINPVRSQFIRNRRQ